MDSPYKIDWNTLVHRTFEMREADRFIEEQANAHMVRRLSMIAVASEKLSGATVEFEYTDDCREFVYVDGKLALVFHPPTMDSRYEGDNLICTLKQKVEKRY